MFFKDHDVASSVNISDATPQPPSEDGRVPPVARCVLTETNPPPIARKPNAPQAAPLSISGNALRSSSSTNFQTHVQKSMRLQTAHQAAPVPALQSSAAESGGFPPPTFLAANAKSTFSNLGRRSAATAIHKLSIIKGIRSRSTSAHNSFTRKPTPCTLHSWKSSIFTIPMTGETIKRWTRREVSACLQHRVFGQFSPPNTHSSTPSRVSTLQPTFTKHARSYCKTNLGK